MDLSYNGSVLATSLYGPYGVGRYATGTMPSSKGYTGQRQDSGSGLDYYSARYYDGAIGQFTSADSAQGPNRFAYVSGNPETANDPTGEMTVTVDGVGGDWVDPNNTKYPDLKEKLYQDSYRWGYRDFVDVDEDRKYQEEHDDGELLFKYFGSIDGKFGPSVWMVGANSSKDAYGTTADYVVGNMYPALGAPDYFLLKNRTPVDLYMPKARPGYDWSNTDQVNKAYSKIVSEVVRKGNQAGIVVIDVTNVPTLQDNPRAEAALTDRIIDFQPNARAGTSVMRVIYVWQGINVDDIAQNDFNPYNYGPYYRGGTVV